MLFHSCAYFVTSKHDWLGNASVTKPLVFINNSINNKRNWIKHSNFVLTVILFRYHHSVQQQQVETSPTRVRLHLRGRVWLQPEFSKARRTLKCATSSPHSTPRHKARLQREPGHCCGARSQWSGDQTSHERARGVHQGLDSAQRGNSQVFICSDLSSSSGNPCNVLNWCCNRFDNSCPS